MEKKIRKIANRVKSLEHEIEQIEEELKHMDEMLMNPENITADINLRFNADLQENRPSTVKVGQSVEDDFGRYRGWEQVMTANGLFDEPRFTLALAEVFLRGRLFRQALHEFARARALLPTRLVPQLWYARLVTLLGDPEEGLAVVDQVRRQP